MEILKQLVVEVDDLLGDILPLEPADISLTAQDALFAPFSPSECLTNGSSHTLGIIRCYIEVVGATCLLKTGACAGHDGQTCTDGFDDGDAKTFIE